MNKFIIAEVEWERFNIFEYDLSAMSDEDKEALKKLEAGCVDGRIIYEQPMEGGTFGTSTRKDGLDDLLHKFTPSQRGRVKSTPGLVAKCHYFSHSEGGAEKFHELLKRLSAEHGYAGRILVTSYRNLYLDKPFTDDPLEMGVFGNKKNFFGCEDGICTFVPAERQPWE